MNFKTVKIAMGCSQANIDTCYMFLCDFLRLMLLLLVLVLVRSSNFMLL